MTNNGFGRRQLTPQPAAERSASSGRSPASPAAEPAESLPAPVVSRTAGRSVAILAVVGGLVVCTALGAAVALNAATGTDGPVAAEVAAAPQECRGQAGCTNEYSVALSCGSNDEPRAVSVQAADREAAERKAERYNRDCRSSGAVFVASLIRTAASTTFGGPRAHANRNAEHNTTTASSNSTASGRRSWRFRRR